MHKFNRFAILTIVLALTSLGCAGRAMQPTQPIQPPPQEVERSVEVEEGSFADYTVRAGHATVEAAQGAAEAAEEAYDWAAEKKRRAKAWLHDATEPEPFQPPPVDNPGF